MRDLTCDIINYCDMRKIW